MIGSLNFILAILFSLNAIKLFVTGLKLIGILVLDL